MTGIVIIDETHAEEMMSSVAHDASLFVPPAEVEEVELYHPKTFVGKYIGARTPKSSPPYAITGSG